MAFSRRTCEVTFLAAQTVTRETREARIFCCTEKAGFIVASAIFVARVVADSGFVCC